MDKHGLIDRDGLKSLYADFKALTKTQGKRYSHNKMGARRTKLVNHIANNDLRYLYLCWLKCKGLKWNDIDKALKDLIKHCAISSLEKREASNLKHAYAKSNGGYSDCELLSDLEAMNEITRDKQQIRKGM